MHIQEIEKRGDGLHDLAPGRRDLARWDDYCHRGKRPTRPLWRKKTLHLKTQTKRIDTKMQKPKIQKVANILMWKRERRKR